MKVRLEFVGELQDSTGRDGNQLVGFPDEVVELCRGDSHICDSVMSKINPGKIKIVIEIERVGDE